MRHSSAATAGARGAYERDGFYIADRDLLPRPLVERAVEGMDAVRRGEYNTGRSPQPSSWNPGDDPERLCKIEQPQFANRGIHDLLTHRALGEAAAEITGAGMVQIWWVQLLYKPPASAAATNVGWHQDRYYWGCWEDESELFTAWIALSDVTADSGPMRFAAGSHRWGFRNEGDFFGQDLSNLKSSIHIPDGETWSESTAVLPPGGISFHDKLTFHGSGPNLSGLPRRSLAVHMRTQNSRPINDKRTGLTEFIGDFDLCPVIFGTP